MPETKMDQGKESVDDYDFTSGQDNSYQRKVDQAAQYQSKFTLENDEQEKAMQSNVIAVPSTSPIFYEDSVVRNVNQNIENNQVNSISFYPKHQVVES